MRCFYAEKDFKVIILFLLSLTTYIVNLCCFHFWCHWHQHSSKMENLLMLILTCCNISVLVPVLANFNMSWHSTFPTKWGRPLAFKSAHVWMDNFHSKYYQGACWCNKHPNSLFQRHIEVANFLVKLFCIFVLEDLGNYIL